MARKTIDILVQATSINEKQRERYTSKARRAAASLPGNGGREPLSQHCASAQAYGQWRTSMILLKRLHKAKNYPKHKPSGCIKRLGTLLGGFQEERAKRRLTIFWVLLFGTQIVSS